MVARNPDPDSTLPYLLRVPLGDGVILQARETWPRTAKVYCHRVEDWPGDAEVVERVAVRSCVRRGAAIDLVLDRSRENRSQLVLTRTRGRETIFWQNARTSKKARPAVATPTARASAVVSWRSTSTTGSGTATASRASRSSYGAAGWPPATTPSSGRRGSSRPSSARAWPTWSRA
nr:hypothetical protein [Nocardioides lianchengensis]